MNTNKLTTKLEGFRKRNTDNPNYINKDIYRMFYTRDIYYIAYNAIKSNDGAETTGSDGTSLHGFCENWIDEFICSMRDESYLPNPSRTTYIPKQNGKMRKLSFPNGKDKIIQECVRMILDCIYEPSFSDFGPMSINCYICDVSHNSKMFHRQKVSLLNVPYSHIVKEMVRINRRQLCLFPSCFTQVSNNELEYNQISKIFKLRKSY